MLATLAGLLAHYMRRTMPRYTPGVLSKYSGVPKATIVNWLEGRVERPRRWHDLVAVAAALRLDRTETERLLSVAGHPSLASLHQQAHTSEAQALLAVWPDVEAVNDPPQPLARRELPTSLNRLIGRGQERLAVGELLSRPEVRMVTLTGPGGVGKTRLALQVAADLQLAFTDGVYLVEMAAIHEPLLVGPALAEALGIVLTPNGPLLPQLLAALRSQQLLLVLDNCEQVLEATPLFTALLAALPGVKMLVTSRVALRSTGSHTFCVPPLQLPAADCPRTAAALINLPAVKLFVERARATRHDFAFDDGHAAAVASICEQLDGVPLALELAASWLAVFSPAELLANLARCTGLCGSGNHDLPARQATLQANMDWSCELLEPPVQAVLARLAVFGGGFTLAAAAAVAAEQAREVGAAVLRCSDTDIMLSALATLVDHSLVQHRVEAAGGRFQLLATTRNYGETMLAAAGELQEARQRHAAYFYQFAMQQRATLFGPTQAATLARLEAERANLRAALAWHIEHNPEAGAHMALALYYFWAIRGQLAEGQRLLELLLARLPEPNLPRMLALDVAGTLAYKRGHYQTARAYHQEHLALRKQAGDEVGVACAWNMLGYVALHANEPAQAYHYCESALMQRRKLHDPHAIALSLDGLGQVLMAQGAADKATLLYAESMQLKHQLHDLQGMAVTLRLQGQLAHQGGDRRKAFVCFEEGLMLAQAVQATESVALLLRELGQLSSEVGNQAMAERYLAEGSMHARRMHGSGP